MEFPDDIQLEPNLATALAWDNYDVNAEALDGKNTLHATVGICYQNITIRKPEPTRQISKNNRKKQAPISRKKTSDFARALSVT